MKDSEALRRLPERARPGRRIVCFHHAGGTAYEFRRWSRYLPEDVEVCAVQLPGRDDRFGHPLLRTVEQAVADILPSLKAVTDCPYVLFGHSMGALLAFESSRALRREGQRAPSHLFVSARRAPQLRDDRPPSHLLDNASFLERIRHYGGLPDDIASADLLEIFLPVLRADVQVIETYDHRPEPPLAVPVTACGGASDQDAGPPLLSPWREHTTAAFELRMFPGGHFFLREREARVVQLVAEALRTL